MTFDKFNETCRCTLENAIDIVLKHARKKHAFLIVDEVNRLALTQSAHSPFQEVMAKIGQLIDGNQEPRINFVCSSLASIPLIDYETFSGRKYQVRKLRESECGFLCVPLGICIEATRVRP